MKKILIVGPKFWNYNSSIARAFKHHGFDTKIIDFYDIIGRKNKILYSYSYLLKYSIRNKNYINHLIISTYNSFKPDIVLIIKGTIIIPETFLQLNNTIKILWMMDSIYRFEEVNKMRGLYDWIFTFEKTDIFKLAQENVTAFFLPMALDETLYYPISNMKKDIDIFFVGSLYDERLDFFHQLISDHKNKIIKIFGKRKFVNKKPFKYYFNKTNFPNRFLLPAEINTYYNRSKFCLNIHKSQSQYGVNPRFFEILGTKSLQIVNNNLFINEYFSKNEILTFHDYEDLKKIIDKNFNNNYFEMIENSFKKVLLMHTYKERIRTMLDIIDY